MDPAYLEGCEDKTDEDGKDPRTDAIFFSSRAKNYMIPVELQSPVSQSSHSPHRHLYLLEGWLKKCLPYLGTELNDTFFVFQVKKVTQ